MELAPAGYAEPRAPLRPHLMIGPVATAVAGSVAPIVAVVAASGPGGGEDLGGIAGWVAEVIAALGPVGVGLMTALESVFPPIPSEVVLPLAGYLASRGRFTLVGAVVAATVGSLAGAVAIYEGAAAIGDDRLRRLLHRIPLVDEGDIDRARGWFDRHGASAVLFGRCIPGVRSLISIPAGSQGMERWRFWLYTTVGSALWNLVFVVGGWWLGSAWTSIGRYSHVFDLAIIGTLVVVVARFVWVRRHRIGSTTTSST